MKKELKSSERGARAFTRTELLVVVLTLAVVSAGLLLALELRLRHPRQDASRCRLACHGDCMTLENPDVVWFGDNESPPAEGNVLVLNYHHDGESHWCTPILAITRIEQILDGSKPEDEWGPRMEAMRIVPFGPWYNSKAHSEARAVYDKAYSEAGAVHNKAYSEAGVVYAKAHSEARAVYDKAYSEARAVYAKARSEAGAVYAKACSEAGAVYEKAYSEAGVVYAKAHSEARAVYAKACSEARAVYEKAYSEAGVVYAKALSEARAVYAKACSEAGAVYNKAYSEAGAVYYSAEAWAVEWKEPHAE